jgi:hypothetical protein
MCEVADAWLSELPPCVCSRCSHRVPARVPTWNRPFSRVFPVFPLVLDVHLLLQREPSWSDRPNFVARLLPRSSGGGNSGNSGNNAEFIRFSSSGGGNMSGNTVGTTSSCENVAGHHIQAYEFFLLGDADPFGQPSALMVEPCLVLHRLGDLLGVESGAHF